MMTKNNERVQNLQEVWTDMEIYMDANIDTAKCDCDNIGEIAEFILSKHCNIIMGAYILFIEHYTEVSTISEMVSKIYHEWMNDYFFEDFVEEHLFCSGQHYA